VGDVEAGVGAGHVTAGVEVGAAEGDGHEGAHVALLAVHVGAGEVRREDGIGEQSLVEAVDGRGHCGLATDLLEDGRQGGSFGRVWGGRGSLPSDGPMARRAATTARYGQPYR
jgi:hypothetical protein